MRPSHRIRVTALVAVIALVLAACGTDDEPEAAPAPAPDQAPADPDPEDAEPAPLSVDTADVAINGGFLSNQAGWVVPRELFLEDYGFTSATATFMSDQTIPALISGDVWLVQDEAAAVFPALDQQVADLVIVGVWRNASIWMLAAAEHIETPEDLAGATMSVGPIGGPWYPIADYIMENELGVDPTLVERVSIGGNSDDRTQAFLAGQIDVTMPQERHLELLEEANANLLFYERVPIASEYWVVERAFLEDHRDTVCAFVEARIAANQWAAYGADGDTPLDEILDMLVADGHDPDQAFVNTWDGVLQNWSLDGGATVEAWDTQLNISRRAEGEVSPDFDWRDHVDLDCLWQAQENLGLPLNPHPDDL